MNRTLLACASALLLCSCSHNAPGPQSAQNPAPSVTLQNPITFPLVQDSAVLTTKKFSQTLAPGQRASALLSAGAGTYSGNETVAGTSESFSQLQAWLRQLERNAPKGYQLQSQSSGVVNARQMVNKRGVDFAVFRDAENPKRAVLVVALDPAVANRNLGPAVTLLKRYQMLPAALRGNIDDQLKRRSGISIEQLMQPGSPLGIAVNTMGDFSNKNQRAIVLVDAAKQ